VALRPQTAVLVGAVIAAGSMVAAFVVWSAGVHGVLAGVLYAVLALIGLGGALLTLRDLNRP
jgi:hypothetical protein